MASDQSQRTIRLKELFQDVDPIEITGTIDLSGKTPLEIAALLPRFTTLQQQGENPAFGILVDPATGRMWSLRSGLSPDEEETWKGIRFKTGTLTKEMALLAGEPWWDYEVPLAGHLEGQSAAFMRKMEVQAAILYTNSGAPCKQKGKGCFHHLHRLLAERTTLIIFNKNGRQFSFTGTLD